MAGAVEKAVEAVASPVEKVVETVAAPLGLRAMVRRVPDWAWVALLAVGVLLYLRHRARKRVMVATGAGMPGTVAIPIAPPVPGLPAPAINPSPASQPVAVVPSGAIGGLLGGGAANHIINWFGPRPFFGGGAGPGNAPGGPGNGTIY